MKILYQDKHCRITDLYIMIFRYYFPLATSKTIIFNEIQKIDLVDAKQINHSWGISTSCLNNWFHLDGQRTSKQKFLSIKIKDSNIKPSVTPTDPLAVFNILRNYFNQINRKSVAFRSNVDKLTQIEQKQVNRNLSNQKELKDMKYANLQVNMLKQKNQEQPIGESEQTNCNINNNRSEKVQNA